MGKDTLHLGLIGCGRISQVHLTTIQRKADVQLVAVGDVEEEAARGAAEAYGGVPYTDPAQMLREAELDAVVLCTPPDSHRALSEAALAAGVHVLCEKPLAITTADAEAMVAAAEKADRVLMMASKFRYVEDLVKARAILQSGILGEIILFENEFCSHVDMKGRWNSRPEISGGGVLIDNGSHSVDIVRYLLGPIRRLQALRGKQWQELAVEDTCRVFALSEDGTMASIDLSWSVHKESPYYIHVYGTQGTLEIGWQGSRYRQSEKLSWVEFGRGYDKFRAVGAQLDNFVATVRGQEIPRITARDAVASVRAVQAAYSSAEKSHWEKVGQ